MIVELSDAKLDDRTAAGSLRGFGAPLEREDPRVLFWLPHGIGDAVMASPAIAGLRAAYPAARIEAAFFRAASRAVLDGHAALDATHLLATRGPAALARGLARLRHRHDVVVVPGGLTPWKHRLPIALLGARACAGVWPRHLARPWFSHGVIAAPGVHESRLIAAALRRALPRVAAGEPFVSRGGAAPDDGHELLRRLGLDERPVLVVATGCEPATPYKRWPLERFVEVARVFLRAHPDFGVWVPLGPGEADHQAAWEGLGDPRVRVTRDVPLATVALGLARCALVLANDSALAHLAGAQRVPTVVVFGPTDPGLTHPLGSEWTAVTSSGACDLRPCFPHFGERFDPRDCANGFACLRSIGVEDVVRALERRVARLAEAPAEGGGWPDEAWRSHADPLSLDPGTGFANGVTARAM